jgi:hypothetical protein
MDSFGEDSFPKEFLIFRQFVKRLSQASEGDDRCFCAGFSEDKIQPGDIEVVVYDS